MKYLIHFCFIGLLTFSAEKATAQNMANGKKFMKQDVWCAIKRMEVVFLI